MAADPLVPLLDLADVGPAFEAARGAFDGAMRHRALRRSGGAVAVEVGLRCAVASAALSGAGYLRDEIRAGTVTDPVVQGALRITAALDGLAPIWSRAPRQALARLHMLSAADVLPADEVGRPVADPVVAARLDALAALVTGGTAAPPALVAAVIHGELLALKAFAGPNGLVARGAARLVLIAGGYDPRGLLPIDVGHLDREPEYVGAAGAFATGTPDGVRSWLRHWGSAAEVAAAELTRIADGV